MARVSPKISFRTAIMFSEEDRLVDMMILDAYYAYCVGDENDHEILHDVLNYDQNGDRHLDESGEIAELITRERIDQALERAAQRSLKYVRNLQRFHAGFHSPAMEGADVAILEEPRTFIYRSGTGNGEEYSLCTPDGNDMVNLQISRNEAMEMVGDWIEHYNIGLGCPPVGA